MSYSFLSESNGQFDFGIRLGLTFVVQTALLSAISVVCVLALVLVRRPGANYRPFSHPIGLQFMSLLLFDFIQSIGSVLHIPWIYNAHVEEGLTCTVQGIFKQFGDVGSIAIHTFLVLAFKVEIRPIHAKVVVGLTYFAVVLVVVIGFAIGASRKRSSIYGDTGYSDFPSRLAALISLCCYGGMALIIRGNLTFDGNKPKLQGRKDMAIVTQPHTSLVWHMLFYPALYIVTIIPISISRFISFSGKEVPYQALFFASCLFSASGLLNSLLFAFTRPSLSFHGVSTRAPITPATSSCLPVTYLPDSEQASVNKSYYSA
ncbi:hypothetical protein DL96DRAFT_1573586 [Flagelloscypha sp. PMI_526]|nr:hypothetical protein DL96DRAFT_1573586 [Flagelloscypha sp. PMI_526]